MIKLTDIHGDPVLVQEHAVLAVTKFRGDTRQFKNKPNAVVLFQGGGHVIVLETTDTYWDMQKLGLNEPL